MDTDHLLSLLRNTYGGRRWILADDVLAGTTPIVAALKALGATGALVVAARRGAGDLPDPAFAPDPITFNLQASSMAEGIHGALRLLANLPAEAVAQVDAFDPERRCKVLGSILDDGRPVAGRAKFGARHAAWRALEDKTTNHLLWDAVGLRQAPQEVVPADAAALASAAARLDQGAGTVQSGDAREGFNGGAEFLRWVRTPAEQAEAASFFAARCDQVRVMPFLEGIPCSIHGIVFPEETAVLRPCEMLVFRRPGSPRFHYGRAATFWDPPAADRAMMRDAARRVGEHLRATLSYRGAFTVDGILTQDGFVPTELNPRFGAALGMLSRSLPELPMTLLNMAVVEGVPAEWRPAELEALLLRHADHNRTGGSMAFTERPIVEELRLRAVCDADGWREAAPDEPHDAALLLGPGGPGGILFATLQPDRTPVGPPAAPRVAALLAWADARLDLGIGPLEPAREVRCAPRTG
jgi:hypothetical protein